MFDLVPVFWTEIVENPTDNVNIMSWTKCKQFVTQVETRVPGRA